MRSRKRAFISVGTAFAIVGVSLGTAALSTVMSVTGGFRAEFRDKVLGVNAHVLVLKYASEFPEYREVMKKVAQVPGVIGVAPFVINPMMITHGDRTATGVLLKGVDPARLPEVLDLPKHMVEGSLEGLRLPGAKPPERKASLPLLKSRKSSPLSPPSLDDPVGKGARKADIDDIDKLLQEIAEEESLDDDTGSGGAGTLHDHGGEGTERKSANDDASDEADPVPALGEGKIPDSEMLPPFDDAVAPPEKTAPDLPADAPVGLVEPEDGYDSVLPEDDVLPAELETDPCKSPGAAEKLPGIVIGVTLKSVLGAKLGDCLLVTSPTIGFSFSGGHARPPVAKQFRVTGVFEAGFDQYDSKLVYTDLYEAQTFYDGGDTVTGVEMKIDDIDRSKEITQKVEKALGSAIYHTLDWEELNHGLFTALRIQQILMSLVLALIMIVAAFTVIATLIMVVLDKKREIAVLKAMGATDGGLLRSFLYQGLIMGLLGAVTGLGLGYAVCRWILIYGFPLDPKVYFISHLPVDIRPVDFLLTGLFAVLVCLAATLWPAMHASRLRPAEAFREQ
jgi:lipoprotein-releasing system permease protein